MAAVPRAWHRRAGRLALAVGGLVAGVMVAEGLARLVQPAGNADLLFNSPDATPLGLYETDSTLLLLPVPGFHGESRSVGYKVPIRIDSLGLRGPEPGPKTGFRWLAVGDSFTMALQVPEAQTFCARLARATGQECWNAGVDGYSTWQETERYVRLADRLDPDGVLAVFFLGNDFTDDERFPQVIRHQRVVSGQPVPRAPVSPVARWLLGRSYLYAHYRVWREARRIAQGTAADPMSRQWHDELVIFHRSGQSRLQALAQGVRRALSRLRDETRKRGDRLVVAVAPPAFVVDSDRVAPTFRMVGLDPSGADLDAPARALERVTTSLGIQTCDLVAPLKAAAGAEALYYRYDGHWTPAGHRIVAEALARCLSGFTSADIGGAQP